MKKVLPSLLILCCLSPSFALDDPIFQTHNAPAGYNYTVKDFYVYEYSADYLQAYARLKYSGPSWREFVKLTVSFFKSGSMVSSSMAYIDYETYGDSGMWPGSETFADYFIAKVDFDSVLFSVSYSSRNNEPKFNKYALAVISTSVEPFWDSTYKISGLVQNMSGVFLQFPKVFLCVYLADQMIEYKYTYVDAPDDSLEPGQIASFTTYLDLPANYDSIKYLPNYSVSSSGDIIISDVEEPYQLTTAPREFSLSQNYPNPFNASTIFRFCIDRPQEVRLEVFDINGKTVMVPFSGAASVGEHVVRIEAGDLSSGVYAAVLTGEGQKVTRKITFLK
jgi:hypothetical protein